MSNNYFESQYHVKAHQKIIPVLLKTARAHFSTPSPRFVIFLKISDIERGINLEFEFPVTPKILSRKPYELSVKDFECLKFYFITQEEIEDYAPNLGYSTKAIMGCIHSFLNQLETEVERHYAKETYPAKS